MLMWYLVLWNAAKELCNVMKIQSLRAPLHLLQLDPHFLQLPKPLKGSYCLRMPSPIFESRVYHTDGPKSNKENISVVDVSCYTIYYIQCHQFSLSCSILPVNGGVVLPTLNVDPTLFVILCKMLEGLQVYSVANIVTHQAIFHPNFKHPRQFSSQVADTRRQGFG